MFRNYVKLPREYVYTLAIAPIAIVSLYGLMGVVYFECGRWPAFNNPGPDDVASIPEFVHAIVFLLQLLALVIPILVVAIWWLRRQLFSSKSTPAENGLPLFYSSLVAWLFWGIIFLAGPGSPGAWLLD